MMGRAIDYEAKFRRWDAWAAEHPAPPARVWMREEYRGYRIEVRAGWHLHAWWYELYRGGECVYTSTRDCLSAGHALEAAKAKIRRMEVTDAPPIT